MAKWLALSPKVLIFDEPTRGIDVGAKAEIYELIRKLASEGVSVIVISSEMEEVLGISDRIAVMHEGRITGILERDQFSEEAIMVWRRVPRSQIKRSMKKELGIFVLLVLLCIIVSVINPNFLLAINLQNLARQIGVFGIFSIGLGLVIITGGIELSVGSMMALLGVLMSMMLTEWHVGVVIAVTACVALAMSLTLIHGLLITRLNMQPFIVTLCGLAVLSRPGAVYHQRRDERIWHRGRVWIFCVTWRTEICLGFRCLLCC